MLKNHTRTLIIISFIIMISISSCRHNPVGVENQPKVNFSTDVLPIIQSNCGISGCHDGRGETRLNLGIAKGIMQSVTPYQPLNSRLYTAITDSWGNIMPIPPSPPLSKEMRTTIYVWILQGADTTSTVK